MTDDEALKAYLGESTAWELDRAARLEASEKRAWWTAMVAVTAAAAAVIALSLLAPLKQTLPYLIRVDATTGVVDVVPPADHTVSPTNAMTRYLLSAYVTAHERFILELAPHDYALTGSMQSALLNERLARAWDRANPESPLNRYRAGSSVQVRIHSITGLPAAPDGTELSQVRYSTVEENAHGGTVVEQSWIATLGFRYVEPSKDPAQRELNPLGLRVTAFEREPELASAIPEGRAP